MLYVVAYDVRSNRRRQKILGLLKDHGFPTQLSVAECELEAKDFDRLRAALLEWINPREDRLAVYRLCKSCAERCETYGRSLEGPTSGW